MENVRAALAKFSDDQLRNVRLVARRKTDATNIALAQAAGEELLKRGLV